MQAAVSMQGQRRSSYGPDTASASEDGGGADGARARGLAAGRGGRCEKAADAAALANRCEGEQLFRHGT